MSVENLETIYGGVSPEVVDNVVEEMLEANKRGLGADCCVAVKLFLDTLFLYEGQDPRVMVGKARENLRDYLERGRDDKTYTF